MTTEQSQPDNEHRRRKPEQVLHLFSAIGTLTERVVQEFMRAGTLEAAWQDSEDLEALADAFRARGWSDEATAEVLAAWFERASEVEPGSLKIWVAQNETNDASAVIDCMNVLPPDEIAILRRISTKGSQKIVFSARWQLTQKQVVVKKLREGTPSEVFGRESQSHPLSIDHPNIIETHFLRNREGELFLVEEQLKTVLSDSWRPLGDVDTVTLLTDLLKALEHLHVEKRLVHGDVKPDNIGKNGEYFVLLDFGICRPLEEYTPEMTATGSLRTRAPELLMDEEIEDPAAIDVWALGATLFNALHGRFPLFEVNEEVPRIWQVEERAAKEKDLQRRVETEYEKWVALERGPEQLRPLLAQMLDRVPKRRPTSQDALHRVRDSVPALIRRESSRARFSPADELGQIASYLPDSDRVRLLPPATRNQLEQRLQELQALQGWDDSSQGLLLELRHRLQLV